jgi:hypothetical protein
MGYEHIEHLYKHPEFFKTYKEAYALEKIHGTSTWIDFANKKRITDIEKGVEIAAENKQSIEDFKLTFHSGGEKTETFAALFDQEFLKQELFKIVLQNNWHWIRVHGEGYGGKQQKMFDTYGPVLKFIVFDIKINGEHFLDIAQSEKIAQVLNLEFVHYEIGPCTPEWFDQQTKIHSIQAIRNGIGEGKLREGIIVRPIKETIGFVGRRVIYKHKNPEFWEISSDRPLGEKLIILMDIHQITTEWVTDQRADHVINHIISERELKEIEFKDIKTFVNAMIEDVKRESQGEVQWSIEVEKEIKKRAGLIFQSKVKPPPKKKKTKLIVYDM